MTVYWPKRVLPNRLMAASSRGPLQSARQVDAQQHYAGHRLRFSEHKVAEILVFREQ
ncbi:MAG: hypothetical protein WBW74_22680 [Xanthobacteraceae bacterium]